MTTPWPLPTFTVSRPSLCGGGVFWGSMAACAEADAAVVPVACGCELETRSRRQCLQTIAALRICSAQNGHVFVASARAFGESTGIMFDAPQFGHTFSRDVSRQSE